MSAIIPRWEWRTFGTRFGVAEERFAALESTGVQESDETYLLGGATGNAKDPRRADGHQAPPRDPE